VIPLQTATSDPGPHQRRRRSSSSSLGSWFAVCVFVCLLPHFSPVPLQTPEEVAAYEAWKPISRKKKRQMERAAMLAEMGEGDEEPEEQEKKKKKKKKEKKNIETIFTEEDNAKINQPPLAVGPTRPPPQQSTDGDGDGGDD